MTDDLNQLLSERPVMRDDANVQSSGTVARNVPPSPTVLDLDNDKWSVRRGWQLAEEWNSAGIVDWPNEFSEVEGNSLVTDCRAILFEPKPKLHKNPIDAARAAWTKQLFETPEYRSFRNQTVLNNSLSEIGAKPLADEYLKYRAENPDDEGEPGDGDGEDGEGGDIGTTVARIRSTGNALKAAQDDIDTAKSLSAGLGMGSGGEIDRAAIADYFKQVKDDDLLRKIFAWAGRGIRRCHSLQKQKSNATRGEITGIELSGDISRLVPRELAEITGVVAPELQDRALYRLMRKRSLSYKHKKVESVQSGPIVLCVDESGSMSGEPIVAAKGIALTLAWLATYQRRWMVLVSFSGDREQVHLALPPQHDQQQELIDWLTHFFNGGTTAEVPLEVTPFELWPTFVASGMQRGKTDMVIITDDCLSVSDEMRDRYRAWAASEQVKTFGIQIGGYGEGTLEKVCDRVWNVNQIALDGQAVEAVLSM